MIQINYTKEFITEWFERRFGKEASKTDGYFEEWIRRFETGNPESYMDIQSYGIFQEMLESINLGVNNEE